MADDDLTIDSMVDDFIENIQNMMLRHLARMLDAEEYCGLINAIYSAIPLELLEATPDI